MRGRITRQALAFVPGLAALRSTPPRELPRQAGAGLAVAAVAIPGGLALAELMGLPPVMGLYASIAPMIAYALFGPSPYLIVGPDTAVCLLVGTALSTLGLRALDERAAAASALALIAAAGFTIAAIGRLGFIANMLSRPILVGYLGGVALTLLIAQIGAFTGVEVKEPGLIRPVIEIVQRHDEIRWISLEFGLACFVVLWALRTYAPRLPGHAIMLVGAILASWILGLPDKGVETIGALPSGLPGPGLPHISRHIADLGLSALGLVFVSFSSGVLTARSFGEKLGVMNSANLELRGFAIANLASGLFHGFPVTGADSRTAVSLEAGGRTPWSAIIAAVTLALVIAFLTAPLAILPKSALGAVLALAALGLVDVKGFVRLARIDWNELVFALVAMAGVIWVGVLQGVLLAVAVTLIHLLRLLTWPRTGLLGSIEGRPGLYSIDLHPEAVSPPDGLIFRFEAPLLFMNAEGFHHALMAAVGSSPNARFAVIDASSMPYADSTAVHTLTDLQARLQERGVRLMISGAHGVCREILDRSGLLASLGPDAIHPNARAAFDALRRTPESSV